MRTKSCPICNRLLFKFEPCYEKYGCGDKDCPARPMFQKLWSQALIQFMGQNKEFIDTTRVESWRDFGKSRH